MGMPGRRYQPGATTFDIPTRALTVRQFQPAFHCVVQAGADSRMKMQSGHGFPVATVQPVFKAQTGRIQGPAPPVSRPSRQPLVAIMSAFDPAAIGRFPQRKFSGRARRATRKPLQTSEES